MCVCVWVEVGGEKLLASNLKLCMYVYAEHQTVTKNRGGVGWGKVIPNPSIYLQNIRQWQKIEVYLYMCNSVINGSVAQCVWGTGWGLKIITNKSQTLCVCLCRTSNSDQKIGVGWGGGLWSCIMLCLPLQWCIVGLFVTNIGEGWGGGGVYV